VRSHQAVLLLKRKVHAATCMIQYWIETNTFAEPPASSAMVLTGGQMVTAALVECNGPSYSTIIIGYYICFIII
jgi:hypothetical protein